MRTIQIHKMKIGEIHKCPECGHPFSVKREEGLWVAWCETGVCPSQAMNDGEWSAESAEDCFRRLHTRAEAIPLP